MAMTRVVVLSQDSLPREAWRALLSAQPGLEVAGAAADPEAFTDWGALEGRGCVLVDSGQSAEIVRRLGRLRSGWSALVLVDAYDVTQIVELIRAGALGVISRNSTLPEFVSGVVACSRGELLVPGPLAAEVLSQLMGDTGPRANGPPSLSSRETEVLQLLAQGLTNKTIAQALLLSVRTVETHLRAIYEKLGVASRTEAVLWAVRHGFDRPD